MYFTDVNAARIDAVRRQIRAWRQDAMISATEERLLIADLCLAANRVANIAGTYGCFLSHWLPQAQESLVLRPRVLFSHSVVVDATIADVADLRVGPEDVVYLDPPYTKRQYAAYYHVLETIAAGDEPPVGGVTGLRPWQDKASAFCYRTRALRAILDLVSKQRASRILLSYSDEGHVDLQPLAAGLRAYGALSVVPLKAVGRYRPNRAASNAGSEVTEYLLVVDRRLTSFPTAASA